MQVGATLPIYAQLASYDTTKYLRAVLRDPSNVTLATANLTHIANGYYFNTALTMPNQPYVTAQILVYEDSGFTQLSPTEGGLDMIFYRDAASEGGSSGPATSAIVGVIDGDEQLDTGVEDVIVKGSDRTLAVRLVRNDNGEPMDLSTVSAVEFRLPLKAGSTALSVKSTDSGTPVTVTVPAAGKVECKLTAAQTALLKAQTPSPFAIVLTFNDGTKLYCNLKYQLGVEDPEA